MANIFGEGKSFWKLQRLHSLDTLWVENFARKNRSISHGLGDMRTFAFFSIQNSQLLIYLINFSLIYEAIPPKAIPYKLLTQWTSIPNFRKLGLIAFLKMSGNQRATQK